MEQVDIYALASSGLISEARSAITHATFAVLGVSDSVRHRVEVSDSGGWLQYFDRDWLEGAKPPGVLPKQQPARERAESFVRDLSRRLATSREMPAGLSGAAVLPPARPVELSAVPRRDGMGFDHWLYRAVAAMPPARGERAIDVFGGQLEVRVGAGGQVVGFVSRWRPLTGERVKANLTPPPAPAEHKGNHSDHQRTPFLVYVLEGDGVPQWYLAPYWYFGDEHGFELASASPYSLRVELAVGPQRDGDGAEVTAIVAGGSLDYRFAWALRRWHDQLDDGIRDLGEQPARLVEDENRRRFGASTIELDPGHYLVLVNVRDEATGAFKHHQELVSTGPVPLDAAPRPPLVA